MVLMRNGLAKLSICWDEWIKNFEKFEHRHDQIIAMVEQVRFERELLTKTVGSQNKLSNNRACSGWVNIDDIVKKAAISVDEAKAVVRFHGPSASD